MSQFAIPYDTLLSGFPINLPGFGSFKSPKLSEIYKDGMRSFSDYMFISQWVSLEKDGIWKFLENLDYSSDFEDMKLEFDALSKFEILIYSEKLRAAFIESLALFSYNNVLWLDNNKSFVLYDCVKDEVQTSGVIDKTSYLFYEGFLRQLCAKASKKDEESEEDADFEGMSEEAKRAWKKSKTFEKQLKTKAPVANSEDYSLGNIISKLSINSRGYTLLNIYELTIFQLYDQFGAYLQNRMAWLGDNIFANHGGEDYDCNAWLHREKE